MCHFQFIVGIYRFEMRGQFTLFTRSEPLSEVLRLGCMLAPSVELHQVLDSFPGGAPLQDDVPRFHHFLMPLLLVLYFNPHPVDFEALLAWFTCDWVEV